MGDTLSHAEPPALAVKLALGVALTDKLFEAGEVPPAEAEKDNEVGLTVSVLGAAETVNVTGTLTLLSSP